MNGIRSLLRATALAIAITGANAAAPAWADEAAGFTPATPMHHARGFQTATQLRNGDVLVAGGYDGSVFLTGGPPSSSVFPDSEIYRTHSGTWKQVAPMHVARAAAVAVRLRDGRVLVVGGFDAFFNGIASAEIYNPRENTWTLTGPLNGPRAEDFVATLLSGGRVLIAGGYLRGNPQTGVFVPTATSEIWDPRTNAWSVASPMHFPRGEFSWTKLHDGRILVAGGNGSEVPGATPESSAEIYDPETGSWTLTGSMNLGRLDHSGVLLENGRFLVAGGEIGGTLRTATAELYNPRTGTWTLTGSMTTPRSEAEWSSVRLPDGNVLVAGGFLREEMPQSSTDLYNVDDGTWTSAGAMSNARSGATVTLLSGERGVLVAGGLFAPPSTTSSVDIYRQGEEGGVD